MYLSIKVLDVPRPNEPQSYSRNVEAKRETNEKEDGSKGFQKIRKASRRSLVFCFVRLSHEVFTNVLFPSTGSR